MQNSKYFSFRVWFDLKEGFTCGCDHWGQSTTIILCIRPFQGLWRTNTQMQLDLSYWICCSLIVYNRSWTHCPNLSLSSRRHQRCKGPINTHRQRDGNGFNIYQTVGLTANTVYNQLRFVRKSQFNSFVSDSFYVVDLVKLWEVAAGQDKRTGHSWIRLV